jgi:DNA-binding LacI/PurR family transcriptional regulator
LPTQVHGLSPLWQVGRLQAEHLIARGHRRLGYALPKHPGLKVMADDRLQNVTQACREAGLEPPMALSTDLDADTAAKAVAKWRARRVTAVCAFNDETAIAVLAGMRRKGLSAPDDLAVIGVDDIPTASLAAPGLTTIRFDLREVARQRAESVVDGLGGREPRPTIASANPQIVKRDST